MKIKKIVAVVAAAVMALGMTTIAMADGSATATLNLNNDDWTVSAAGNATITTAEVTGNGDYVVKAEFAEDFTSGMFNALEIENGETVFGREYVVTVTSIKVDGNEVMEAEGYTCSADGGAITTRVNLYNEWNSPNTDVASDGYVDCRATGDVTACSAKMMPYNTTGKVWEVSFTVSGLAGDDAAVEEAADDSAADDAAATVDKTADASTVAIIIAAILGCAAIAVATKKRFFA